jgi:hypothetical protein
MDAIFRRIVGNNFSELPGLQVDARVPVPEPLVNEILEEAIRGNKNIESCRASIGRQNRVSVNLKTPLWPWAFNLKLKLFSTVDFSGSPKARAFLENNVLLGKLGALFKALPEGIFLYENQISVDIGTFIQDPEQRRFLDLIKAVEISTEEGRIIFNVTVQS